MFENWKSCTNTEMTTMIHIVYEIRRFGSVSNINCNGSHLNICINLCVECDQKHPVNYETKRIWSYICIYIYSCRSTLRLCLHHSWVSQRYLYKVRAINNKNIFRVIISVQFDKQNNEPTHSFSIQWHMHSLFITHLQTLKIQYLIIICWKFICTHAIEIPFRQCNH